MFTLERDGFTQLGNVPEDFMINLRALTLEAPCREINLPCGRNDKVYSRFMHGTEDMKTIIEARSLQEAIACTSLMTAYPRKRQLRPRHQQWHMDTSVGEPCCLCFVIYNTNIEYCNGPTEFQSKYSKQTHTYSGPPGTCLAFSTDTLHRGLENVSSENREIFILSFNPPQAPPPYGLKWPTAQSQKHNQPRRDCSQNTDRGKMFI